METIDYEELIGDQEANLNKVDQYKKYSRLKDIAANLKTMCRLVEAEEKERALEAARQQGGGSASLPENSEENADR